MTEPNAVVRTVRCDMGDPEPAGALSAKTVDDYIFCDEYGEELRFGRTNDVDWKGYLDGKFYVSWDEMTRRFGPLDVEVRADV